MTDRSTHHASFTLEDLMDVLVDKCGLPAGNRGADREATFETVGLDSLAYLQLQTELHERYGFELADDRPVATFGAIVDEVADRLTAAVKDPT